MAKPLVVMVGAPGSGKSTVSSEIADMFGYEVICPDTIRGELFGDEGCQEKGWLVFKIAYERVESALDDPGVPGVIFDSTGASRRTRRELAKIAAAHGCYSVVCWVDEDAETCKARNAARSRVVPDEVIDEMSARISQTPPAVDEGHDGVFFPEEIADVLAGV